jgi:hypothetical protein
MASIDLEDLKGVIRSHPNYESWRLGEETNIYARIGPGSGRSGFRSETRMTAARSSSISTKRACFVASSFSDTDFSKRSYCSRFAGRCADEKCLFARPRIYWQVTV